IRAMALNKGFPPERSPIPVGRPKLQSNAQRGRRNSPTPLHYEYSPERLLDGAARGHDLLLGRTRALVDRDGELHRDVPVAEDLDLLVLTNGTLGDQVADGDVPTLGV